MQIKRSDRAELKIVIEDREYVLLIPIGSQLDEGLEVTLAFASAFNQACEALKEKKEQEESTEVKDEL